MKTTFVASGNVRGACWHQHKTWEAAQKCADRDQRACRSCGGGAYSDRAPHLSTCRAITDASVDHRTCDCQP